jgi:spermidine/putrescine transport system permease protein
MKRIHILMYLPLFYLIFFMLVPVLSMLANSFISDSPEHNLTLANYANVVTNASFVKSFYVSIEVGLITAALCLLLGYPIAYGIARYGGKKRSLLLMGFVLPFFIAYIIRAWSFVIILGERGILNTFLMTLHLIGGPVDIFNFGMSAMIIGEIQSYIPFAIMPIYAALEGMDFDLVEAARDLGANSLRAFKDITLPLTMSGVITGFIYVFIPEIGSYIAPLLLGGGKFLMVSNIISDWITYGYSPGEAAAGSIIVILVILALTFVPQSRRPGAYLRE